MGEEFWQKEKCKLLLYLSIPKQKESIKAMAMVTIITNHHPDLLLLMKMVMKVVMMVTKKMKILQKKHHRKEINTNLLTLLDRETSKAHLSKEVHSGITLLDLETNTIHPGRKWGRGKWPLDILFIITRFLRSTNVSDTLYFTPFYRCTNYWDHHPLPKGIDHIYI